MHDLRHSAASLMIARGAPIELVRDQLGHSSLAVTQRYAHLYPGAVDDVMRRLDDGRSDAACGVPVGLVGLEAVDGPAPG